MERPLSEDGGVWYLRGSSGSSGVVVSRGVDVILYGLAILLLIHSRIALMDLSLIYRGSMLHHLLRLEGLDDDALHSCGAQL